MRRWTAQAHRANFIGWMELLLPSNRVVPSVSEQDHASGQLRWSPTSRMMPRDKDELWVHAAELQPPRLVRATEQPRSWTEEKLPLTEGHP